MAGTSKNPSSNSGKSNGAPGAALVYVKCGYTVCQFSHDSGVTPPRPPVSHLNNYARVYKELTSVSDMNTVRGMYMVQVLA